MGSRTHFNIYFLLVGGCYFFVADISAAGNNQFGSDTAFGEHGSSFFFYANPEYPRDCSEVHDFCRPSLSNGVYLIKPDSYEEPFEVYCDNVSDAGGWTMILRRSSGSVYFNRNWGEYKKGFGFLSTEFWLGNDKLSYLTNQAVYELNIGVTFDNGRECNLQCNAFRISDEWSNYTISTVGIHELNNAACRWKEGSECDKPEAHTGYTDCNDVYSAGHRQDGVYYIRPEGWEEPPFKVFCNMSIDGGNWTVFQRRVNGSTNFYRNWNEYRNGFGDLQHEFWLGNEKLHFITKQATYEYRIDYVTSSSSYYNKFSNFHVNDNTNLYRLASPGTRSGTRGYSLSSINNTPFSTHDQDNDGLSYDCAEGHRSGWWHGANFFTHRASGCSCFPSEGNYIRCSYANPNGDYNGGNGENIFDLQIGGCNQIYTELKIRRTT